MKDCNFAHEARTIAGEYAGHFYAETITVNEALRIFDADIAGMRAAGAKEIFVISSLAIFLTAQGYHIFKWNYLGAGYATGENRREKLIIFLQRWDWGWVYWRCFIARRIGFDWQSTRYWPHRRNK